MRKFFTIASLLIIAASLSAKHYPDSVRQQSQQEPHITYGWNFEFAGGLGVGSYLYSQLGQSFTPAHVKNKITFPAWHAELGINYYFVSWMGIGTGVQFGVYPNRAAITQPWTDNNYDKYNDNYTLTSTPDQLNEMQQLYMVEIPLAFKFRARPGVVGFTGTAGIKLGIPVINRQQLQANGVIKNSVYYPLYDLTMSEVPSVVENLSIPSEKNELQSGYLKQLNYAAYVEIGMLIRLHQRVDLAIAAYANYYFNDVLDRHDNNALGFNDGRSIGEYPVPYTEAYQGVLRTNEVQSLHPWSVGLKIGLQINANRTQAQREYDREQRRLRDAVPVQQEEQAVQQMEMDTVPAQEEEVVLSEEDKKAQAIEQIRQIAAENDLNICEVFCAIHDTIYIKEAAEEELQAIQTNAVADMLEEELEKAIIYFEWDKAVPILEPEDILVRIADVLKRHPEQKIHINGHTCRLGTPEYNKRLALRRAKAVAARLKKLGVRDDQMTVVSLGEDVPYRYHCKYPYAKDRRVEIIPVR
jgi:outer membrane protein OmpA-like peptidoglycan-associated protein